MHFAVYFGFAFDGKMRDAFVFLQSFCEMLGTLWSKAVICRREEI